MAVEGRADARGQAERAIAEVATLISRAQAQLKDPDIARLNGRTLRTPRATVAAAEKMLQEARSALANEDYASGQEGLERRRGRSSGRFDRNRCGCVTRFVSPQAIGRPDADREIRQPRPRCGDQKRIGPRISRKVRMRRDPATVEDDLGPPGQEDPLVSPLDALRAARRDHLDVSPGAAMRNGGDRRRTRAGAGRVRRARRPAPRSEYARDPEPRRRRTRRWCLP